MEEELFDLAGEYEAMLNKGISLSGEDFSFFVRGRVEDLLRKLPGGWRPRRILDFGCGVGHTSHHLSLQFPQAEVVGIDTSARALERAISVYASPRVRFETLAEFRPERSFDLCYTNGVFHHIVPKDRPKALDTVAAAMADSGYFALFENNPWNPGTRMVMSRIPFDRDAQTLSPKVAVRMLRDTGIWDIVSVRSLFYFPRFASFLRVTEPWLSGIPLGAQYYVLATRRSSMKS